MSDICSWVLFFFQVTGHCWKRGALGYIRNCKTEGKNHPKLQKNSAKTENCIQNRQKPIQRWQVGHTEQTKLTLISPKYLWMSWTLSEAFVSFCVCLNHRLCFCRSLQPRLCGSISEKRLGSLVTEPSYSLGEFAHKSSLKLQFCSRKKL